MKGYKGFKKGLVCLDKQYEEEIVFKEKTAKICESGMHFCINPLNVLTYYPLIDNDGEISEYTEVKALDECKTNDGRKFCTTQLYIDKKINFSELIKNTFSLFAQKEKENRCIELNFNNIIYNPFNYNNIIININDNNQINNNKKDSQICNSGHNLQIYNNNSNVQIDNAGFYIKIINNGRFTRVSNIGNSGYIINNGNNNDIRNAGSHMTITNNGNTNGIINSGNSTIINNIGHNVIIDSTGEQCVIFNTGGNCKIKAKKGTWIILLAYAHEKGGEILRPFIVCVDGIKIKENVFYEYSDGGLQEVE